MKNDRPEEDLGSGIEIDAVFLEIPKAFCFVPFECSWCRKFGGSLISHLDVPSLLLSNISFHLGPIAEDVVYTNVFLKSTFGVWRLSLRGVRGCHRGPSPVNNGQNPPSLVFARAKPISMVG